MPRWPEQPRSPGRPRPLAPSLSSPPTSTAAASAASDAVVRRPAVSLHAALAAVCYLPLLLSSPGAVSADTKSYLTLDAGRLLAKAPYLWDPTVGMGTVSHQTIGYLWPLGPYYWAMERLGAPDWVAERLWLGTLLFAAGA